MPSPYSSTYHSSIRAEVYVFRSIHKKHITKLSTVYAHNNVATRTMRPRFKGKRINRTAVTLETTTTKYRWTTECNQTAHYILLLNYNRSSGIILPSHRSTPYTRGSVRAQRNGSLMCGWPIAGLNIKCSCFTTDRASIHVSTRNPYATRRTLVCWLKTRYKGNRAHLLLTKEIKRYIAVLKTQVVFNQAAVTRTIENRQKRAKPTPSGGDITETRVQTQNYNACGGARYIIPSHQKLYRRNERRGAEQRLRQKLLLRIPYAAGI